VQLCTGITLLHSAPRSERESGMERERERERENERENLQSEPLNPEP